MPLIIELKVTWWLSTIKSLKPFSIQLLCGGIEYIMTEEEKEDYLYEYVDEFAKALANLGK